MFTYTAYGLSIASEIDLPGFREIDSCDADITVRRRFSGTTGKPPPKTLVAERINNGILFHCPYGGLQYEVRGGREIIIHYLQSNHLELERLPLYGFAMASILQQKGYFVLHASAVEIADKAVVFMGGKYKGKSTIVANLVHRGHRLISDDVTVLVPQADRIMVLSGISCIKLWPDAMEALGLDISMHPALYSGSIKRNYFVPDSFCHTDRQLSEIFVLHQDLTVGVKRMNPSEKMVGLAGGCYISKFRHAISPGENEILFRKCAFFAKRTRMVELNRPMAGDMFEKTIRLVKDCVAGD